MTDYSDRSKSLTDHLAAALKPVDRADVAIALADAFGKGMNVGEKSVIATRLLEGKAIDALLLELRAVLEGRA